MFFGPLLFILLIIGIIFVFMTPNLSNRCSGYNISNPVSANRPLDILNERYAKGEISEIEYLKVKRNLDR